MLPPNDPAKSLLVSSVLTAKSQEILRKLLIKLGHLDQTGKLSSRSRIVQAAHGGNGTVYVAYLLKGRMKVKVALKRLQIYIYKDKDFAKVPNHQYS